MDAVRTVAESPEALRGPLAVSLSCHGLLLAASVAWGVFNPSIELGSPDPAGGGGIVAVSSVPINVARADVPNPLANPTRHNVPAPPKFQRSTEIAPPEPPADTPAPAPVPPAAKRRQDQKQQERSVGQRSAGEAKANELRSSLGATLSSDLYRAGGGGVGFGGKQGGPFGKRFAWYAQILQRAVGEQWRRTLGQVAGGSAKPVVTSFAIQRSGEITEVRIAESSGNRSLDISALRAIRNASPVRALPAGLGRGSIVIEMNFRLQ